jgi:hypothetical protein
VPSTSGTQMPDKEDTIIRSFFILLSSTLPFAMTQIEKIKEKNNFTKIQTENAFLLETHNLIVGRACHTFTTVYYSMMQNV